MLAALLAIVGLAALARAQINTPTSAVQCLPVLIGWTETTTPPYIISILPGGEVNAAAVENIGTFTNASTTWIVDIPSGTSLTLQIRDGTGGTNFSAPFTIQSSPTGDTSCLGTNAGYVGGTGLPAKASGSHAAPSSASGASSASGGTSTLASTSSSSSSALLPAPSSTAPTTSPAAASTTSHSSTSSSSSSASKASTSPSASPTSAALANGVSAGLVGLLGLLGGLLLA